MWRICNNALPTMVNLHWRGIVPNANCALCKDHPEDSPHAVWACEVISGVWNTLDWFHHPCRHNRAPSTIYSPSSCFAMRSLELRFLLPLRGSCGIDVMQSTLVVQPFLSRAFVVEQGVVRVSSSPVKGARSTPSSFYVAVAPP